MTDRRRDEPTLPAGSIRVLALHTGYGQAASQLEDGISRAVTACYQSRTPVSPVNVSRP